ncbi:hypothetical protein PN290_01195 [Romboutsia sp. 1001216sp1]|uniref:hypothetical protein n=1 Tax=unclassified Romboutsia TaxID=2626894 RepID=UPI0018AB2740|nr:MULTISPECIES: hypothetical protein [unclassified Romboutsia]MDB8794662.1 hypothetical protein [Romboutsia sp. 1001216sp1]MDB8796503.1 hypothetical protein [Romboutsia sp. 1001216sp1]MDB8797981.1 hypothetical protein [Romboutsia sp. 1001216sp1]
MVKGLHVKIIGLTTIFSLLITGCTSTIENKEILKNTYFEVVKSEQNSNEIKAVDLEERLKDKTVDISDGIVYLTGENGEQKDYSTKIYTFKEGNKSLSVSYLDNDKKESLEDIKFASYIITKEDKEETYVEVYYQDILEANGILSFQMYPESVQEQKELVNLLNENKSSLYEAYYKVAESIEEDSSLELGKIIDDKLKKIDGFVSNDNENLVSYSLNKDGLNLNLVFDEKINKAESVIIEDIESNNISLSYYKNME